MLKVALFISVSSTKFAPCTAGLNIVPELYSAAACMDVNSVFHALDFAIFPFNPNRAPKDAPIVSVLALLHLMYLE